MSVTAALLGLLALAGGTKLWNTIGSAEASDSPDFGNVNLTGVDPEVVQLLMQLSESERNAILNNDAYRKKDNGIANLWGLWGDDIYTYDYGALARDLQNSSDLVKEYAALGTRPIAEDYLNSAKDAILAENDRIYADLDQLLADQKALYTDQLQSSRADYNTARSQMLSQQVQQGARLMDTYRSEMRRSRDNAMEAGASAGIRIADNINTLLSVQNKQSSTAMETSNQLAQMMVNQRNAEFGVRDAYSKTLSEDASKRHEALYSTNDRINTLYNMTYNPAKEAYDAKKSELDDKYSSNPLSDYGTKLGKYYNTSNSKYSN